MADLKLDFCGVKFKHPIIIASLETTNSPEVNDLDILPEKKQHINKPTCKLFERCMLNSKRK